jgi:hypothetical protein
MTKETKKYLRERWKSAEFISSLPFSINYKMNIQLLNGADLRGLKIAWGEHFLMLPNFNSAHLKNINFSFGSGSISFFDCQIEDLSFVDFQFDRSSSVDKSIIKNSTFLNAKLILSISDTTFENCNFSNSKFSGGFNEYGFRRCKFINCDFTSAFWKNTYILASYFIECNFKDFEIVNSSIRGFKVSKLDDNINSVFKNCDDVTGLIEIPQ